MVKYMRSVKKVALKLVETFADKCDDASVIANMVGGVLVLCNHIVVLVLHIDITLCRRVL